MEHRARITWSDEYVRRGLPDVQQTIDPAWFGDGPTKEREGWSLECRFERAPKQQGNPSIASVRFRMDGAPHERLAPGTVLLMFEGGTGQYAHVQIVS
jgi:hypothetical protein